MAKKPLMFGDATFDAQRLDSIRELETNWDHSYVPGYSEARRDNELRVRDGAKALPMPKLQWVRVGHVDATAVGNKDMLQWALMGYEFASVEDLKRFGYTMPPTAHIDAAGRIRREDVALAFVSHEQHIKNVARQKSVNDAFHSQTEPSARRDAPIERTEYTNQRLADLADTATYVE